jgi:hypothetical protein
MQKLNTILFKYPATMATWLLMKALTGNRNKKAEAARDERRMVNALIEDIYLGLHRRSPRIYTDVVGHIPDHVLDAAAAAVGYTRIYAHYGLATWIELGDPVRRQH